MRNLLKPYLLALAATYILGKIAKWSGSLLPDTSAATLTWFANAASATFWPLLIVGFAYACTPLNTDYPPANVLEHTDRTWFAKWVAWFGAGVLVCQLYRQLTAQ